MLTFTHKITSDLDSWSEMRKAIKSGHADDFHVGDEIEETLSTGEKVTFVVVAVNLYENNQVIFSMKDCLNDPRPMNGKLTNRGGWAKSDLRKWLNADLFNTLPSDLQNSITPRKFSSTCEDKLWLFSEMELFGREIYGSSDNGDKQMPLYAERLSPATLRLSRDYERLGDPLGALFLFRRCRCSVLVLIHGSASGLLCLLK